MLAATSASSATYQQFSRQHHQPAVSRSVSGARSRTRSSSPRRRQHHRRGQRHVQPLAHQFNGGVSQHLGRFTAIHVGRGLQPHEPRLQDPRTSTPRSGDAPRPLPQFGRVDQIRSTPTSAIGPLYASSRSATATPPVHGVLHLHGRDDNAPMARLPGRLQSKPRLGAVERRAAARHGRQRIGAAAVRRHVGVLWTARPSCRGPRPPAAT